LHYAIADCPQRGRSIFLAIESNNEPPPNFYAPYLKMVEFTVFYFFPQLFAKIFPKKLTKGSFPADVDREGNPPT
jgi:hypothetical protein